MADNRTKAEKMLYAERDGLMRRMRRVGCTDVQIGNVFDISHERVRQRLGNGREQKAADSENFIVEEFESGKLPAEICKQTRGKIRISRAMIYEILRAHCGGRVALHNRIWLMRKARVAVELKEFAALHPEAGLSTTTMQRIDRGLYDKAVRFQSIFEWRKELGIGSGRSAYLDRGRDGKL